MNWGSVCIMPDVFEVSWGMDKCESGIRSGGGME